MHGWTIFRFLPRGSHGYLLNPMRMNRLLFGDNLQWQGDQQAFTDASANLQP